jgi:predicted TIM-barrel fold metal-dependent hydrolase
MNSDISSPRHRSQVAEAEATSAMLLPTKIDRRRFLFATAGLSLAWPQVDFAAGADKSPHRAPVVDTHVHCFAGKDNARFPYHPRAPYRPDAPATPQHLLQCMDEAGVDFAIIVHPEPYQDDHRYLEYCFEVGKSRFKGTCLFFADQPESLARMPDLIKRWPIVAARVHAYAPDRLPPFRKLALRELWKVAGAHGLAVQLHFEPRHAPGFEPLIKEFSDVKVVIDHLGRPFQGTPDEHEVVVRWSRFQNTVMKLSAIPSPTTYPHRDIAPIIKRLAQEFGPERMIYGGGFSAEATGTTYRATIEKARSLLSFFSETDQAKVFGENAALLFGFKRS